MGQASSSILPKFPSIHQALQTRLKPWLSTRFESLNYACHSVRAEQQPCNKLVLWRPTHGRARQGRPCESYINMLVKDTNLAGEDLPNAMRDRQIWRVWRERCYGKISYLMLNGWQLLLNGNCLCIIEDCWHYPPK